MLENVQDVDWSADGGSMAVVRYVPENNHCRLEYPIGKVLFDSINWISHPKISPDGKWVGFADHENPDGDDEGSVAVIAADHSVSFARIKLGRDFGDRIEVLSGLQAGQQIVVNPGDAVRAGGKVNPVLLRKQ